MDKDLIVIALLFVVINVLLLSGFGLIHFLNEGKYLLAFLCSQPWIALCAIGMWGHSD
jgi:hypothetical protein